MHSCVFDELAQIELKSIVCSDFSGEVSEDIPTAITAEVQLSEADVISRL